MSEETIQRKSYRERRFGKKHSRQENNSKSKTNSTKKESDPANFLPKVPQASQESKLSKNLNNGSPTSSNVFPTTFEDSKLDQMSPSNKSETSLDSGNSSTHSKNPSLKAQEDYYKDSTGNFSTDKAQKNNNYRNNNNYNKHNNNNHYHNKNNSHYNINNGNNSNSNNYSNNRYRNNTNYYQHNKYKNQSNLKSDLETRQYSNSYKNNFRKTQLSQNNCSNYKSYSNIQKTTTEDIMKTNQEYCGKPTPQITQDTGESQHSSAIEISIPSANSRISEPNPSSADPFDNNQYHNRRFGNRNRKFDYFPNYNFKRNASNNDYYSYISGNDVSYYNKNFYNNSYKEGYNYTYVNPFANIGDVSDKAQYIPNVNYDSTPTFKYTTSNSIQLPAYIPQAQRQHILEQESVDVNDTVNTSSSSISFKIYTTEGHHSYKSKDKKISSQCTSKEQEQQESCSDLMSSEDQISLSTQLPLDLEREPVDIQSGTSTVETYDCISDHKGLSKEQEFIDSDDDIANNISINSKAHSTPIKKRIQKESSCITTQLNTQNEWETFLPIDASTSGLKQDLAAFKELIQTVDLEAIELNESEVKPIDYLSSDTKEIPQNHDNSESQNNDFGLTSFIEDHDDLEFIRNYNIGEEKDIGDEDEKIDDIGSDKAKDLKISKIGYSLMNEKVSTSSNDIFFHTKSMLAKYYADIRNPTLYTPSVKPLVFKTQSKVSLPEKKGSINYTSESSFSSPVSIKSPDLESNTPLSLHSGTLSYYASNLKSSKKDDKLRDDTNSEQDNAAITTNSKESSKKSNLHASTDDDQYNKIRRPSMKSFEPYNPSLFEKKSKVVSSTPSPSVLTDINNYDNGSFSSNSNKFKSNKIASGGLEFNFPFSAKSFPFADKEASSPVIQAAASSNNKIIVHSLLLPNSAEIHSASNISSPNRSSCKLTEEDSIKYRGGSKQRLRSQSTAEHISGINSICPQIHSSFQDVKALSQEFNNIKSASYLEKIGDKIDSNSKTEYLKDTKQHSGIESKDFNNIKEKGSINEDAKKAVETNHDLNNTENDSPKTDLTSSTSPSEQNSVASPVDDSRTNQTSPTTSEKTSVSTNEKEEVNLLGHLMKIHNSTDKGNTKKVDINHKVPFNQEIICNPKTNLDQFIPKNYIEKGNKSPNSRTQNDNKTTSEKGILGSFDHDPFKYDTSEVQVVTHEVKSLQKNANSSRNFSSNLPHNVTRNSKSKGKCIHNFDKSQVQISKVPVNKLIYQKSAGSIHEPLSSPEQIKSGIVSAAKVSKLSKKDSICVSEAGGLYSSSLDTLINETVNNSPMIPLSATSNKISIVGSSTAQLGDSSANNVVTSINLRSSLYSSSQSSPTNMESVSNPLFVEGKMKYKISPIIKSSSSSASSCVELNNNGDNNNSITYSRPNNNAYLKPQYSHAAKPDHTTISSDNSNSPASLSSSSTNAQVCPTSGKALVSARPTTFSGSIHSHSATQTTGVYSDEDLQKTPFEYLKNDSRSAASSNMEGSPVFHNNIKEAEKILSPILQTQKSPINQSDYNDSVDNSNGIKKSERLSLKIRYDKENMKVGDQKPRNGITDYKVKANKRIFTMKVREKNGFGEDMITSGEKSGFFPFHEAGVKSMTAPATIYKNIFFDKSNYGNRMAQTAYLATDKKSSAVVQLNNETENSNKAKSAGNPVRNLSKVASTKDLKKKDGSSGSNSNNSASSSNNEIIKKKVNDMGSETDNTSAAQHERLFVQYGINNNNSNDEAHRQKKLTAHIASNFVNCFSDTDDFLQDFNARTSAIWEETMQKSAKWKSSDYTNLIEDDSIALGDFFMSSASEPEESRTSSANRSFLSKRGFTSLSKPNSSGTQYQSKSINKNGSSKLKIGSDNNNGSIKMDSSSIFSTGRHTTVASELALRKEAEAAVKYSVNLAKRNSLKSGVGRIKKEEADDLKLPKELRTTSDSALMIFSSLSQSQKQSISHEYQDTQKGGNSNNNSISKGKGLKFWKKGSIGSNSIELYDEGELPIVVNNSRESKVSFQTEYSGDNSRNNTNGVGVGGSKGNLLKGMFATVKDRFKIRHASNI